MNALLSILASPGEAFERIMNRPRWLLPILFSVGIFFVVIWLGECWHRLSEALTWPNLLGPALISPLIVGIVSLGSTTFIYLMSAVLRGNTGRTVNFRTLFSVNVHCGIIFLLGEVVNFLLVRANLLGDDKFLLPNRFPTGLDLLLIGGAKPDIYVLILLHSTSVFIVWYLVVLSLGIRISTGSSKIRSAVIAIGLWCFTVGLALSLVYALGGGTTVRIKI